MALAQREDIRAAFARLVAAGVPELEAVLQYEPGDDGLPGMPCVTMLTDLFAMADRVTGPETEDQHGWAVRVYVSLSERDGMPPYQAAQFQLETLVPKVLAVVRAHPDLDGTCERAWLVDRAGEVAFYRDRGGRYAVKTIVLRAELLEATP